MFDIGVIGALSQEVENLISTLRDAKCESYSGIDFHTGKIGEKSIVVAKCGVGKVFAAICAEAMILKYSPKLIINTGVGGALDKTLKTGDIVIAKRLVQHDMDTSALGDPKGLVSGINTVYFEADSRAVSILQDAAASLSLSYLSGTVATGDKFISDCSDKERIAGDFSALACEMEGCAIAHTAFVNNTPFAVVRAISDSADGNATMDYPTFLPLAAKNSTSLTLALIEKY